MDRRTFLKLSASAPLVVPGIADAMPEFKDKPALDIRSEAYWASVQSQFPIMKEMLYFNNGTVGPSPKSVTDVVTKQIQHVDKTADYGYDHEALRKSIGRVLGADKDDIALTHNVSEGISIIASGLRMKIGDEVILTDQEHGGGAMPWLARAKRHGIVVKFVELDPDPGVIVQRIHKAITSRTRAIAIPHVPCTTGQVLPVEEIGILARDHEIFYFVDGAHPPGMMQVDVKKIGCDAYASCGHKWLLGPKGTGFLYIAKDGREQVMPSWSGAEADKKWEYNGNMEFLDSASRYDFGTQNSALYMGLQSAIEWQEQIGFANIEQRVHDLTAHLRSGLEAHVQSKKISILTPGYAWGGVTTIKLADPSKYQEFASQLWTKHKIRTRVVPESNLMANRFSVHVYTLKKDVDTFLHGVNDVLRIV